MVKQNVLIIGNGGREHALAWKIAQSPNIGALYVAPGNGGTSSVAENVPIAASETDKLIHFAKSHKVDLTVVGPDDALAGGIVDAFQQSGLRIFGPTRAAAQIEASKAFAKALMAAAGVPTARFATFTDLQLAKQYVASQSLPLVVKASGLALGKGVYICQSLHEAYDALEDIMASKIFGDSGNTVVIEEFLEGQEVSIHAFCDGRTTSLFPSAQDHKRVGTGDVGPNTGGMGTVAPLPWTGEVFMKQVTSQVVEPILAEMNRQGCPFKGVLYPGLMVKPNGEFKVLEFNARFGDPETQSYLRLLQTDLLEIFNACVDGKLSDLTVSWSDQSAVTVVLASKDYPKRPIVGREIRGVDEAESRSDIVVFHAGTKLDGAHLLTSGGRVLGVSAVGSGLAEARAKAYQAVSRIHFDGMHYRTDIGAKAVPK